MSTMPHHLRHAALLLAATALQPALPAAAQPAAATAPMQQVPPELGERRFTLDPAIRQARTLGAIGACRLLDPATGEAHPAEQRFGWRLHRRALDQGLLVRPIGDCLYLLPPLNTPPARLAEAAETLLQLLDA